MSTDFCFHIEVTFMFLWQLFLYTGNIAMKVNEHEFIVFYSDEIEYRPMWHFIFESLSETDISIQQAPVTSVE